MYIFRVHMHVLIANVCICCCVFHFTINVADRLAKTTEIRSKQQALMGFQTIFTPDFSETKPLK